MDPYKLSDFICSAHFIGNQKSNDPLNPSYAPTIFPAVYRARAVNEASKKIGKIELKNCHI